MLRRIARRPRRAAPGPRFRLGVLRLARPKGGSGPSDRDGQRHRRKDHHHDHPSDEAPPFRRSQSPSRRRPRSSSRPFSEPPVHHVQTGPPSREPARAQGFSPGKDEEEPSPASDQGTLPKPPSKPKAVKKETGRKSAPAKPTRELGPLVPIPSANSSKTSRESSQTRAQDEGRRDVPPRRSAFEARKHHRQGDLLQRGNHHAGRGGPRRVRQLQGGDLSGLQGLRSPTRCSRPASSPPKS